MINVNNPICLHNNCYKYARCNLPSETKLLYCFEHKKENMVNISKRKCCRFSSCKNISTFGYVNEHVQFCHIHKKENMIDLILENKCHTKNCNNEHDFIVKGIKYCHIHHPDPKLLNSVKRICKYCDIEENSTYICNDCKLMTNKKEWSIIRYLRKNIDTDFVYNSSKMLQNCSKKRPDAYFELNTFCLIVEIDEHQHNSYEDTCECARLNEIVNGIGGKSVIVIRYNPDIIRNNRKQVIMSQQERLNMLVKIIKQELDKKYDNFFVKIIQLYYSDNYEKYQVKKEEDITELVCI